MRNSNVIATEVPAHSLLHNHAVATDFMDCYSVDSDLPPRRAAEIITDFPAWVRFLLQVRRAVTTPFGLSNDGPEATDRVGIFPVETDNDRELIAGFNDKHLDFRVSVMSQNGRVSLATWVHPHNIGGRLYLRTILPFHILISRNALRRVAVA